MRPVDFQSITAQTPGVEKSHQAKPQQPEFEQRQLTTIQQQAQEQKMKEAQATPETQESKVQTEKEKERQLDLSKKEREKKEKEEKKEKKIVGKDPSRGKNIDIVI